MVTSESAAALRDFLRVAWRRFLPMRIILSPARVQGEGAAESVRDAIRRLDDSGLADVIVVTRGGGSVEDLWADRRASCRERV